MRALALVLSLLAFPFAVLPLIRVKSRRGLWLLVPNFLGTAWSPYVGLLGALGAGLGALSSSPTALALGLLAAALAWGSAWRVTSSQERAFERGLGPDWRKRVSPQAEARMLKRRWRWGLPQAPEAPCKRDVVFATVPDTNRALKCDLWQPPPGVPRSGLAVVYLHGSAWYLLDKDVGTRLFFRHLAAQGHVVVDVAYRLCPETNAFGMVADAKRAVAWVKSHAEELGVRPERVVLMGGSAGGYVALLAAHAARHPALTPTDLRGTDCSVCAVVSYYGVPDLVAYDAFARRFDPPGVEKLSSERPPPSPFMARMFRRMAGRDLAPELLPPTPPHRPMMKQLAGTQGEPTEDEFDLVSALHHVGPGGPATLHFQPEYDNIVPVESGRALNARLTEVGVPAVYVEYPQTLHAFDLIVPSLFSPAGQASLYDVERFLAWCAAGEVSTPKDSSRAAREEAPAPA